MRKYQIVIDTNVFISALRSSRGASYRLLTIIDSGKFEINISVPLALEYESVAKRLAGSISMTETDIDDIIDYICAVANKREVSYLWRPFSKDPKYDMVLELAVNASCDFIVTFNTRDFRGAEQRFNLRVVTPREFLHEIGDI